MTIGKRTWKLLSGEIRSTWIVRYRDAEGNHRPRANKSKREAEAWVARIIANDPWRA